MGSLGGFSKVLLEKKESGNEVGEGELVVTSSGWRNGACQEGLVERVRVGRALPRRHTCMGRWQTVRADGPVMQGRRSFGLNFNNIIRQISFYVILMMLMMHASS